MLSTLEIPKSPIFTVSLFLSSKMFCVLRSLWRICLEWTCCKDRSIWARNFKMSWNKKVKRFIYLSLFMFLKFKIFFFFRLSKHQSYQVCYSLSNMKMNYKCNTIPEILYQRFRMNEWKWLNRYDWSYIILFYLVENINFSIIWKWLNLNSVLFVPGVSSKLNPVSIYHCRYPICHRTPTGLLYNTFFFLLPFFNIIN